MWCVRFYSFAGARLLDISYWVVLFQLRTILCTEPFTTFYSQLFYIFTCGTHDTYYWEPVNYVQYEFRSIECIFPLRISSSVNIALNVWRGIYFISASHGKCGVSYLCRSRIQCTSVIGGESFDWTWFHTIQIICFSKNAWRARTCIGIRIGSLGDSSDRSISNRTWIWIEYMSCECMSILFRRLQQFYPTRTCAVLSIWAHLLYLLVRLTNLIVDLSLIGISKCV